MLDNKNNYYFYDKIYIDFNLTNVGKFITERRKKKNMTQEQLSENLFITDRAVSKWERGLSLPADLVNARIM